MTDNWDDEMMPDDGDYSLSVTEALRDVAVFLVRVLAVLLPIAAVIAFAAYSIWKEFLLISFLTGN